MATGDVAVVGAGLAGLAAAMELKRLGYRVDLYERSRLVGGKATSFEIDGVEVDNGQHVFLACCEEFISFLSSLGLSTDRDPSGPGLFMQQRFEAVLLQKGRAAIHLRSAELPAPFQLLPALLASRQLGIAGRLQVGIALTMLRGSPVPGETFGTWLSRYRQGARARKGFWEPFVVPALNAPLNEVAAQDAAFVIETAFLRDPNAARFGYSLVPLAHIAKRALDKIDKVRLRTPVVGIALEDGFGTTRRLRGIRLSQQVMEYDGVVVAVPPHRLKGLLGHPKDFGVFGLDQFRHAAIVDVHLWFEKAAGHVLGLDSRFAAVLDSPVQWVFEKEAPPGETYLCCSMSAADRYAGWKSEELVQLCRRELDAAIPELSTLRLLRSAATRDREATFVPSVGLVRPGPRTACPQLALAGAWTDTGWPATMESAVRSGRRAVEVLHGSIGG